MTIVVFFLAAFDFYIIIVVSLPFTAYQWSSVQPILFLYNKNMRAGRLCTLDNVLMFVNDYDDARLEALFV